ncbi:MAG TPA: sensor histidine kinase, partial [Flavobacteriaceae bacterium]|nr:sensor histidine kinase [Flavobacteriaceae bacterium]
AIQNSVLKNDQLKSAELIAIFSKLIRQNLEFSNRKQISLDDEIDMLTNYLETQKFRFNNIFDFKINVDKDVDKEETQIPPMLLQPFIENSIEHGLKHKEKGGLIKVNISKIDNGINICIEDNGIGRDSAKVNNKNDDDKNKIHAIKIFRERLKNRQKKEMDNFAISDIVDNKNRVIGTKVEFNLID